MDKFNSDFEYFWNLIDNNINFTFARYADGEVMLMKGLNVSENTQAYQIDKWNAPNQLTKVGRQLLATLNHTEENYYYAISAPSDSISDYDFLKGNITQSTEKITFVNLWINGNYKKMIEKINNLKRDVVLICNDEAKIENFPFKVIDFIPFPNDCINFWETNGNDFIKTIIDKAQNNENTLFLISCGPISELIIDSLYRANQNNTYVDVGSSIDEYVHGYKTRPYMNPHSHYSNMISNF